MRRTAAGIVLALAAAAAGAAQDTVVGRMVPARPDAPSQALTTTPRAHYVLHCAGCHGLDGAGARLGYVPDMRRLGDFLRLPGGRAFVVGVPGVRNAGLDEAQLAAVMNWLMATLARGSLPEAEPPFAAAEFAAARRAPIVDVAAARRRLVEAGRAGGIAIAD